MTALLRIPFFLASLEVFAIPLAASATNMPPTLTITGYGMGPYLVSACAADAADPDGSIAKVEFYASDQKIGESASPPYCYSWNNAPVGVYTLTAVATDNEGATSSSPPITVEVKHPLEGRILSPTNEQIFVVGEQIRITASTTNGQGAVTLRYDYDGYSGGFPELTNAPYELLAAAPWVGNHFISGLAWQESWNPSPYAALPRVPIHVIPVRGFPAISVQPTNRVVLQGTNVLLSVRALSELPVAYQWQFNDVDLSGATNADLVLSNIGPQQDGRYTVLVSTATGASLSDIAFVDVLPAIAGKVLFANQFVSNGVVLLDAPRTVSGTIFEARLYAGRRPDALDFIEPAITFSNSAYFDGGVRSIATVAPGEIAYAYITVQSQDPTNGHQWEMSNFLAIRTGNTDSPAPLLGMTVPLPPGPLTPDPYFLAGGPWLELGTFGGELTIKTSVQSYAQTLRYQWQKDGQDIPGASGVSMRTSPYAPQYCTGRLLLRDLQIGDIARYRLRVDVGTGYINGPAAGVGLIEPTEGRFVQPTVRDGVWRAQLHGRIGQCYSIQFSTNLMDWTTISTITNLTAAAVSTPADSHGRGFYRALTQP